MPIKEKKLHELRTNILCYQKLHMTGFPIVNTNGMTVDSNHVFLNQYSCNFKNNKHVNSIDTKIETSMYKETKRA